MRHRQLTLKQLSALHYLSTVRGKSPMLGLPVEFGPATLTTLAQGGFVSVRVRLSQKGWDRLYGAAK